MPPASAGLAAPLDALAALLAHPDARWAAAVAGARLGGGGAATGLDPDAAKELALLKALRRHLQLPPAGGGAAATALREAALLDIVGRAARSLRRQRRGGGGGPRPRPATREVRVQARDVAALLSAAAAGAAGGAGAAEVAHRPR